MADNSGNDAASAIEEQDIKVKSEQDIKPDKPTTPLHEIFESTNIKDEVNESKDEVRKEELGGDVKIKTDDKGQPVLARTPTVKKAKPEPILWNHLPSAKEQAALAFQELESCVYMPSYLGESGQEESMSCDCKPELGMCSAPCCTNI